MRWGRDRLRVFLALGTKPPLFPSPLFPPYICFAFHISSCAFRPLFSVHCSRFKQQFVFVCAGGFGFFCERGSSSGSSICSYLEKSPISLGMVWQPFVCVSHVWWESFSVSSLKNEAHEKTQSHAPNIPRSLSDKTKHHNPHHYKTAPKLDSPVDDSTERHHCLERWQQCCGCLFHENEEILSFPNVPSDGQVEW